MPRAVVNIRREHVEAFITDQLTRLRPASAANRFRSLQQFFAVQRRLDEQRRLVRRLASDEDVDDG
jgi:hypothetical protein